MHRLLLLLPLIAGFACRSAADVPTLAALTSEAAHRTVSAVRPAPWLVRVLPDSVPRAEAFAEALRAQLRIRAQDERDSLRYDLTVFGIAQSKKALQIRIEVATTQRCGPTWQSSFGYFGEYMVHASRRANTWQLDSIHPLAYGDPGVCSSELARLLPNER